MSRTDQQFSAHFAKDAEWQTGARSYFEYRDLGIKDATHGAFNAHVIRLKNPGEHGSRTTGAHQHALDFQMFYVLKGWVKFLYEGKGMYTFHAGDCCLQPPGLIHDEIECSDDVEILEVTSPAVFKTIPATFVQG